jgi:hypothetical protein
MFLLYKLLGNGKKETDGNSAEIGPETPEEIKKREIIREKGWYIPSLHNKYLNDNNE